VEHVHEALGGAIMGLDKAISLKNGELCSNVWAAQRIILTCGVDASARPDLRAALASIEGALHLFAQGETGLLLAKDHIAGYISNT
jgi:hypothetical protein